ncbi:Membrane-bound lytic murein transglycosylase F [Pandoraea capi]|uniref:Membrane-bound lytic murein transglycosylase F n=1 Tax=Pandoraea capi TaxID=2508286 RepID=A0ABY6W0Z2_9BURK|nr:transglycosylase SLT domain-containing protein [Pandoraea capi]VVE12977.1 Membrane-bound lytic murein transglycosylase F [Pandoraea capi]
MAGNAYQITITAADRASAVAKRIEASMQRITKPIDRVTASSKKMNEAASTLRKPFADVGRSLKALGDETGVTKVARGIRRIGYAAADAGRSLLSIVAPLAGIAGLGSIAGIALMTNEWGKMGAEVLKTSAAIGVSAADLQAYRGAAKLAGLSADEMTGSLKTLGKTIEDATYGRNQDAFVMMQKFGISLHRTKDGAVDATRALKDVANAIVKQKGNVQTQALIADVFGVGSLLPMLQKGESGINAFVEKAKSMGLVLSDEQLRRAAAYNEQMIQLEASGTKLKYSFGEAMAPALERVIGVVQRLVDQYGDIVATKVAEYVERFAKWLETVNWDETTQKITNFIDAIGGVKGVAIALAAITFAAPTAGIVSIIANLTSLTAVAIPGAVAALGTLGVAGLAAWGALKVAKAAGLPDTNSAKGASDVAAGNWWAASTSLPALSFIGAGWDRLTGKSNADIAAGLRQQSGAGRATNESNALFSRLESQYGLPKGLLDSVWAQESGRGTNMRSPAGAKGHFQFMDATAKQYGLEDPDDLTKSATAAAQMYRDLLKQNGGDLSKALAGYNWGQGNLQRKGMENAPKETRNYVDQVQARMGGTGLYGNSPRIAAANLPGQSPSTVTADAGRVHVDVVIHQDGRPATAKVRSQGNTTASAKVTTSKMEALV